MSRFPSLALACLAALIFAGGGRTAGAVTLSMSCGAVGLELELCRKAAEAWSQESGHEVKIVSTPNSSTERLALYQQILAAQAGDIDVLQVDIVWPGLLGSHFVDLNDYIGAETVEAFFPALIAANTTAEGALLALPLYTDAGMLYARQDLLEKYGLNMPDTWEALTQAAEIIQAGERAAGNADFWGYVWQGRAYEGLTCNILEWVHSHGGGSFVEEDGTISIANPQAQEALSLAASWVDTISPTGVLNYSEEEARGVFQSGNAAFMRNWPYAWALGNAEDSLVKGKIAVAPLPRGPEGESTATLGGWSLAVSRYSKHPELAADLVKHMTGVAEQKRRAQESAYNPTRPALYQDADILAANPFFATLPEILDKAVARPSTVTGRHYNRVSNAIWSTVHAALSGEAPPESQTEALEARLRRIGRGGRW